MRLDNGMDMTVSLSPRISQYNEEDTQINMELYYQVINFIVKESPRCYENTEEEPLTQSGRSKEILQKSNN